MNKFTVTDVLEAIRKNGLHKIQGNYYATGSIDGELFKTNAVKPTNPVAACSIGQAAINLNCTTLDIQSVLGLVIVTARHSIPRKEFSPWGATVVKGRRVSLLDYVLALNDGTDLSFQEIADICEAAYNEMLHEY
jgi:hypothetical protein